jgi:hypothetical protein
MSTLIIKPPSAFYYFRFCFGFSFSFSFRLKIDRSIAFRLPSILVLRGFGPFFSQHFDVPQRDAVTRKTRASSKKPNWAVIVKRSLLTALPQDVALNYLLQKPTRAKYRNRLASKRTIKPSSS